MKEVSLLIFEDVVLSSVSGVLDILTQTNLFLESSGKEPAFKVGLVSEKTKNIQTGLPAQFVCYKTIDELFSTDLIIVPAFHGDAGSMLSRNHATVTWLKEMNDMGTEVASLCRGSYFLAEAGLLNGRSCTTHWADVAGMQERYPSVKMLFDKVVTDVDGIYTSGGAFSSLNLILYLIEKFCGHDAAIWASKMFSIDLDRMSQSHFAVFQGQRQHEDEEILRAQTYIEENFHAQISVEHVAEQTNMSKRNFIRRFKSATKNTPLEYLQRVKIESAKKALEKNNYSILSLMYDVGYNDLKTFRTVFKRITGLTPQDYRRKYSRE